MGIEVKTSVCVRWFTKDVNDDGKKHKISTASTLLNGACNLPNTLEGKSSEVNHVTNVLLASIKKDETFPGTYSFTGRIGGLVFQSD